MSKPDAISTEKFEQIAKMTRTKQCQEVCKLMGVGKKTVTKARKMFPGLSGIQYEPHIPEIHVKECVQTPIVHAKGSEDCVHYMVDIETDWPHGQDIFRCKYCGRLVGYPRYIPQRSGNNWLYA